MKRLTVADLARPHSCWPLGFVSVVPQLGDALNAEHSLRRTTSMITAMIHNCERTSEINHV